MPVAELAKPIYTSTESIASPESQNSVGVVFALEALKEEMGLENPHLFHWLQTPDEPNNQYTIPTPLQEAFGRDILQKQHASLFSFSEQLKKEIPCNEVTDRITCCQVSIVEGIDPVSGTKRQFYISAKNTQMRDFAYVSYHATELTEANLDLDQANACLREFILKKRGGISVAGDMYYTVGANKADISADKCVMHVVNKMIPWQDKVLEQLGKTKWKDIKTTIAKNIQEGDNPEMAYKQDEIITLRGVQYKAMWDKVGGCGYTPIVAIMSGKEAIEDEFIFMQMLLTAGQPVVVQVDSYANMGIGKRGSLSKASTFMNRLKGGVTKGQGQQCIYIKIAQMRDENGKLVVDTYLTPTFMKTLEKGEQPLTVKEGLHFSEQDAKFLSDNPDVVYQQYIHAENPVVSNISTVEPVAISYGLDVRDIKIPGFSQPGMIPLAITMTPIRVSSPISNMTVEKRRVAVNTNIPREIRKVQVRHTNKNADEGLLIGTSELRQAEVSESVVHTTSQEREGEYAGSLPSSSNTVKEDMHVKEGASVLGIQTEINKEEVQVHTRNETEAAPEIHNKSVKEEQTKTSTTRKSNRHETRVNLEHEATVKSTSQRYASHTRMQEGKKVEAKTIKEVSVMQKNEKGIVDIKDEGAVEEVHLNPVEVNKHIHREELVQQRKRKQTNMNSYEIPSVHSENAQIQMYELGALSNSVEEMHDIVRRTRNVNNEFASAKHFAVVAGHLPDRREGVLVGQAVSQQQSVWQEKVPGKRSQHMKYAVSYAPSPDQVENAGDIFSKQLSLLALFQNAA